MGRHKSDLKVLKSLDVVSTSPTSSTSSQEVIHSKTKRSPKKKMSAFINTFYNSFSSAGPSGEEEHYSERTPEKHYVYTEMELLKVTAPKYDLQKFEKEIYRVKENVGIRVEVKPVIPTRKHEERLRRLERREKENYDLLDYMFSDTIPFFHDFLICGTPETQFYQIKGQKGDLDIFNKLCRQMIFGKELQCKLEVTDRRDIPIKTQIKNSILGGPNSEPDLLDSIFSSDLSSCNPFFHNLCMAVY